MQRSLRKLAAFASLPGFERCLFLCCWLLLGLSRAAILGVPFKHLAPLLGRHSAMPIDTPAFDEPMRRRARQIGSMLRVAARHTPWTSNCYAQAVTARLLLGSFRLPCAVFFGLNRARPTGPLEAHAWVTAGDVGVCGGEGLDRCTAVACFVSHGFAAPARWHD